MKTIAKLTIVSSSNTSITKHIQLGDSIEIKEGNKTIKITLNNIKMVYSENDEQEGIQND